MCERVLITGVGGFIGFHVAQRLLKLGIAVIGIDNLNTYYDRHLKEARLEKLKQFHTSDLFTAFEFYQVDIIDKVKIDALFEEKHIDYVIHLAAQAGVRYSLENPYAYLNSNVIGFLNLLEACKVHPVRHFMYASSSSVYGNNKQIPYSTNQQVDHPLSLYAATKKSNELIAHAYSHLYGVPVTGLRFFTVYGPWGRPDMAYFSFCKNIIEGKPIKIFNYGRMERDFTYISDIVTSIVRLLDKAPKPNSEWEDIKGAQSESTAPYKIYNIGSQNPVSLECLISTLENLLEKKAERIYVEMKKGDVTSTWADIGDLEEAIHFKPHTTIEEGLERFVEWYRYYNM